MRPAPSGYRSEFQDYIDFYSKVVQLVSSVNHPVIVEVGDASGGFATNFLRDLFNGSEPTFHTSVASISSIDLLHVDKAPHTYEDTRDIISMWLPHVRGVAVFHDAGRSGVLRALSELPDEWGFFIADTSTARDKESAPAVVCRGMQRPNVEFVDIVEVEYGPRIYGIGDIIFTLPGLEELSRQHNKPVYMKTKFPEVFENNPYFYSGGDHAFPIERKKLNFQLHKPTLQHEVFARQLGVTLRDNLQHLYVTQAEVDSVLPLLPDKPFLISGLMLENMGWAGRNYPLEHTCELLGMVKSVFGDRLSIVEVGKKQPKSGIADVDLVGRISLRQYFAVASLCTFYVGVDTMPSHVARAFNKPSLLLYGGIYPQSRVPEGDCVTFLRADELECIGCYNDPKNGKRMQKCDKDEKCMKVLTPDRVFATLEPLLNSVLGGLYG